MKKKIARIGLLQERLMLYPEVDFNRLEISDNEKDININIDDFPFCTIDKNATDDEIVIYAHCIIRAIRMREFFGKMRALDDKFKDIVKETVK